jgi:hypothetical protein
MWAAYFLQPKMRVYLLRPSYLPVSPPGGSVAVACRVFRPPGTGKPLVVTYYVVKGAGPLPTKPRSYC